MQQGARPWFQIQLPDGCEVDVRIESEACAFLQTGSLSKEYIKGKLERMNQICSKKKLNARDKNDLAEMNMFFQAISRISGDDVFREHVEESSVRAWLNYATQQIKRNSTNRNWITTGTLPFHDTELLNSCIMMMAHAVPTALAFEGDLFTVLGDFVKARKGTGRALPCDNICYSITIIVSNAYFTSRLGFDNKWTNEKALKKLEATGILEQFLRCVTVPQSHDSSGPGLFMFLDEFQQCMSFISKKVQPGQPCGDVIKAILEGKDGSRVQNPIVLNKFRTMVSFANSIDPKQQSGEGYKLCRSCGKAGESKSLLQCSRCRSAHYCSKECQRADWKVHKIICTVTTKKDMNMFANAQQMTSTFLHTNYVHIMVKMLETCKQTGLSKNDLILEVDFMANKNGIVPAMQDKPEFKIAPTKDYVEGSRPAEPDWFYENIDRRVYEKNVKEYIAVIKEKHRKLQSSQIMTLVRYEGGYSTYASAMLDPTTQKHMFSEKAVLAFKAKIDDDDDGPLSEIFGPRELCSIKRKLFIHYSCGEFHEDMRGGLKMEILNVSL